MNCGLVDRSLISVCIVAMMGRLWFIFLAAEFCITDHR